MSSDGCKSVEFGVRVHNNHRFAGHTNACADDTGSDDKSDRVELDGHVCMSTSASTVDLRRLDAPLRPVRKIWCELRRRGEVVCSPAWSFHLGCLAGHSAWTELGRIGKRVVAWIEGRFA